MRAGFSVLVLLIVVAIVGLIADRQLKALRQAGGSPPTAAASAARTSTGTPREQARSVEKKVADDIAKSLDDSAAVRQRDADKP